MAYSDRSDHNQAPMVKGLREKGYDVDPVHRLKKLYDLVVSGPKFVGRNLKKERKYVTAAVRVEVKQLGAKLNENEEEYWAKQNHPDNLIKAETEEDVIRWFEGED